MMREKLAIHFQFSVTGNYSTTYKQDQNFIFDFDKVVKQLKKKSE